MEPEPDPPSFHRIEFAEYVNISPNLVSRYTRNAFCHVSRCHRFAFCPYSTSCCDRCLRGQHSVACNRRQQFIQWHQIFPVLVRAVDDQVRSRGFIRLHTLPSDKCTTTECCRVANMHHGNCCGQCPNGHTYECDERHNLILSMCFPTLALVCFKTFEWRLLEARVGVQLSMHNQMSRSLEFSDDSEPEAESWSVLQ